MAGTVPSGDLPRHHRRLAGTRRITLTGRAATGRVRLALVIEFATSWVVGKLASPDEIIAGFVDEPHPL